VAQYINHLLVACAQSLFVLRTIQRDGLPTDALNKCATYSFPGHSRHHLHGGDSSQLLIVTAKTLFLCGQQLSVSVCPQLQHWTIAVQRQTTYSLRQSHSTSLSSSSLATEAQHALLVEGCAHDYTFQLEQLHLVTKSKLTLVAFDNIVIKYFILI